MPVEKAILIRSLAMWGGFAIFLALELLAPYRLSTASKSRRWATNISLTILNGIALNLVFGVIILGATAYVTATRTGLLYLVGLPSWTRLIVVVAFMDFMLYVWHFLNHECRCYGDCTACITATSTWTFQQQPVFISASWVSQLSLESG